MLIHQALERQAELQPDKIALVDESQSFTYGELNRSANCIGRLLRDYGVGRGATVAVSGNVSPDLVAALVGIMKTGASFVYVEPAHPPERRRSIFESTGAPLLLTNGGRAPNYDDFAGRVLDLGDLLRDRLANEPNLNIPGHPRDLAFVCYTSGSTGRPKGVLCTHQTVVNRFGWFQEQFPYALDDVAGLRAGLGFVISAWELFGPLMAGLKLVLLPSRASQEPALLLGMIRDYGISHLGVVPSLASLLVEHYSNELARLATVRLVEIGGETSSPSLLARLANVFPSAKILHRYGSTEMPAVVCGDVSACDLNARRAPIGRPIANTQAYILDEDHRLLPDRAIGELYLAGSGLAWGYLNDAAETAARFLPNPFWKLPGERFYRTGDLAVYGEGGRIELVGRADFQFKMAGYRIEPGEIERALLEYPGVSRAVAVPFERQSDDGSSQKLLLAYLVISGTTETERFGESSAVRLRAFLQARLPAYMIPSRFITVQSLPLLPNGKIDRQSLSKRALPETPSRLSKSSALRPLEKDLLEAFAVVMGLPFSDELERNCFLDLGGNSIQATRITALLRSRYGLELTVVELMSDHTLLQIANELSLKSRSARSAREPDSK
ncbi:MAG TPA: non-ribosomal peptide synthetase [Blastocatellia bacterium]|nr:non-ribosomal peptide synthetase [Blastocatellia bacterium]